MLKSLEITNLRGIERGRIQELAAISVLVGPNGSGKSTVLEALAIAGSHQPPALIGMVVEARGAHHGARYLISAGGRECRVSLEGADFPPREIRLRYEDMVEPSRAEKPRLHGEGLGSGPFSAIELVLSDDGASEVDGRVVFDPANRYGFRPLSALAPRPRVQYVHPARSRLNPLWKSLTRAREQGRLDSIYSLLRALLGDRFRELYVHPEGEGQFFNTHIQYADGSVPVAVSGDGIRTLVRLALEVAGEAGSTVLIEEPEVHQHPRAIWLTAEAILAAARRGVQVVLSTHSLELIDALVEQGDDETLAHHLGLFRLNLERGVLKYSRLAGDAVKRMRAAIEEDLR